MTNEESFFLKKKIKKIWIYITVLKVFKKKKKKKKKR